MEMTLHHSELKARAGTRAARLPSSRWEFTVSCAQFGRRACQNFDRANTHLDVWRRVPRELYSVGHAAAHGYWRGMASHDQKFDNNLSALTSTSQNCCATTETQNPKTHHYVLLASSPYSGPTGNTWLQRSRVQVPRSSSAE